MMSSENFESLEEDFITLRNEMTRKIEILLPKTSGETRKNTIREIQRQIDEAQKILQELQEEVRLAPNPFRFQMNVRLKKYNQELNQIKKRSASSEDTSLLSTRNELFGSNAASSRPGYNAEISAMSNRGRLLQMNETIDRTTETVHRAEQVAAETDQVGIAVVDELGTQREALVRTKERLVDTDANLSRSRKILRSMYRKVVTNKVILIVAILLELVILAGVLFYKFFR